MSGDTEDFGAIRTRLRGVEGKKYWRSLEALAETPEFQEYLHREFPENATEWIDPVGRRSFLKLMSASLALAGVSAACTTQPEELIVPYVRQPEEEIPGRPLFFATAMTLGGVATGLLVESHEGRPTKVEGNPDHPASLGATDLYAQASLLTLYDPDRSQSILQLGEIRPWNSFIIAMRAGLSAQTPVKGAGLRILTETVNSPTLAAQIQQVLTLHPGAKWIQWEPTGRDNARAAARLSFGDYREPVYDFTKADIVVALDADFLCAEGGANLRYSRDFASRRRLDEAPDRLNRLYAIEPAMSVTGMNADHRVPLKASDIEHFARALAGALGALGAGGATGAGGAGGATGAGGAVPAGTEAYVKAITEDLASHRGTSLVVAGDAQPPAVHVLAHTINQALGNVGSTVTYHATPEIVPTEQLAALRELVTDMEAGRVQMLVIAGESNPVFSAPVDLRFADAMSKVGLRVHSGLFFDETAQLCHWHVPGTHYLEAWSDARSFDGTVSIVQPLIQPMYSGKSAHEVIATLSDRPERNGYDLVREFWQSRVPKVPGVPEVQVPSAGVPSAASTGLTVTPATAAPPMDAAAQAAAQFERTWRKWLHDGFIAGTGSATGTPAATPSAPALYAGALSAIAPGPGTVAPGTSAPGTSAPAPQAPQALQAPSNAPAFEVNFRRDPTIYDGRYANNGWLQELPKPVTKLTWDNAALIAPATAQRLDVENGDIIEIRQGDRRLRIPVWIQPGHAQDSVTVQVGYGRTRAGRVGNGIGFNGYVLRASDSVSFGGAEVSKTGDSYELVSTQDHWSIEGRNIVRSTDLAEFKEHPTFAREMEHMKLDKPISLYPQWDYSKGNQWGMAIDLNTCTGCSACIVACVAENNIPVVGKEQVGRNREMHWLRVDRYFTGPLDNPNTFQQPMPCQQCENAPCEVVCPVAATAHSAEGLNDMVYNRCVGTRYCSNNCPWKVRRFNFLLYQDWNTPTFKLQRNPDVTVRSRGVMEKCTYCVQRINTARIQAKREEREIKDGEILTACQSVCPTDSIVFGNLNDPNSRVVKLKASARNYAMLEELNTRPRTTYLAAVRNPHPALPSAIDVGGHTTETHGPGSGEQH